MVGHPLWGTKWRQGNRAEERMHVSFEAGNSTLRRPAYHLHLPIRPGCGGLR